MAMPGQKGKQPAVPMDAAATGPKEPPGPPPGLHGGPPGMMGAGPAQPTPNFRRADRRPKDAAMQQRWLEQRKDRLKRRRARMQEFKQACGEDDLKKPQIQAMIRVHTWRMARLKRVQELADAENNTEMSQKVEKLRQKELLHFNHLMRSCRTGGEADGGAAPQTSAAAATPAELPDKKEGKSGVAKTEGAK